MEKESMPSFNYSRLFKVLGGMAVSLGFSMDYLWIHMVLTSHLDLTNQASDLYVCLHVEYSVTHWISSVSLACLYSYKQGEKCPKDGKYIVLSQT